MSTPNQPAPRLRSLTHLQLHDVVTLDGRLHRVSMVNECRARCLPLKRKVIEFVAKTGRDAGKTITYERQEDGVNISPDSQLEILGHWNPETESVRFNLSAQPAHTADGEPVTDPFAAEVDEAQQQTLL